MTSVTPFRLFEAEWKGLRIPWSSLRTATPSGVSSTTPTNSRVVLWRPTDHSSPCVWTFAVSECLEGGQPPSICLFQCAPFPIELIKSLQIRFLCCLWFSCRRTHHYWSIQARNLSCFARILLAFHHHYPGDDLLRSPRWAKATSSPDRRLSARFTEILASFLGCCWPGSIESQDAQSLCWLSSAGSERVRTQYRLRYRKWPDAH